MSNKDKAIDIKDKIIDEYTQYLTDFTFKFKNGKILKTHKYLLFRDSEYFQDFFKYNPNINELDFTKTDTQILSDYDTMKEYLTVLYAFDFKNEDEQEDLFKIYDLDKLINLHKYIFSLVIVALCYDNDSFYDNKIIRFVISILNSLTSIKEYSKHKDIFELVANYEYKSDILLFFKELSPIALWILLGYYSSSRNNSLYNITTILLTDLKKHINTHLRDIIGNEKSNIYTYCMHKFGTVKNLEFSGRDDVKILFEEDIDYSFIEQICPYEQNINSVKTSVENSSYLFD